eukprot:Gb_08924 [translate_table: standard]
MTLIEPLSSPPRCPFHPREKVRGVNEGACPHLLPVPPLGGRGVKGERREGARGDSSSRWFSRVFHSGNGNGTHECHSSLNRWLCCLELCRTLSPTGDRSMCSCFHRPEGQQRSSTSNTFSALNLYVLSRGTSSVMKGLRRTFPFFHRANNIATYSLDQAIMDTQNGFCDLFYSEQPSSTVLILQQFHNVLHPKVFKPPATVLHNRFFSQPHELGTTITATVNNNDLSPVLFLTRTTGTPIFTSPQVYCKH